MMSFEALEDFLRYGDEPIVLCSLIKDRRRVQVTRQGFQGLLGISPLPPMQDAPVYDNSWNYLGVHAALRAMEEWNPEEDKEPDGWHRHIHTGRYRIDGDASLEYVKDDHRLDIVRNVAYAVRIMRQENCVLRSFKEVRAGSVFPANTERFVVTSEDPECPHDPKCNPISIVYHYLDRYVALSNERFLNTTVDNVLRRLTSDNREPWEDRNLGYLAELYGMTVVRLG